MRIGPIAVVAFAAALAATTTAADASPIYSGPGAPNQNWTGSLGLDFIVNSPITIDALGAYDGGDGSAPITVEIFTDTGTAVPGLLATILTTTTPYTFQSVAPVTLGPGTYQIAAWGYGPVGNFNTGFVPGSVIDFNTLGGALTEGNPFYNLQGVTGFATILDNFNGGGLHFYGAGNFDAVATPLPASWTMMLTAFVGFGFFAAYRRRKNGIAITSAFAAA